VTGATTVIDDVAIYSPLDDGGERWIERGYLEIVDGTITAIGEGAWAGGAQDVRFVQGNGRTASPGLINTHTHTNLGLYPGLWDRRRRVDTAEGTTWAPQLVPPYTSYMSPADHRYANYLTMIAALKSGTTTLCNCDRYHPELTVQAAEEIGIRTLSGAMANDPGFRPVGPPNWPAVKDTMVELIETHRSNPLRKFFIGAHSLYSCPPEQIQEAHAAAAQYEVDFNIHLAESPHEIAVVRERYGTTPVRFLAQLGVLDERVIANHVIIVDPEEIDMLAASGARVASCPFGAAKTGGVAPLTEYLARGIPVGLGTDSLLSNNSVSMLRELALVIQLQRVRTQQAGALFAEDALRLATLGSARVLNWQAQIGSLEVGKAADVVLYDLRHPWGLTAERVALEVVYAADRSNVSLVMVGGAIVLSEGRVQTVDEDALWRELADVYQQFGAREWDLAYSGPVVSQPAR
jgi:5-methylthioadenosine/S-adenosylhomocysteine deaminase